MILLKKDNSFLVALEDVGGKMMQKWRDDLKSSISAVRNPHEERR